MGYFSKTIMMGHGLILAGIVLVAGIETGTQLGNRNGSKRGGSKRGRS